MVVLGISLGILWWGGAKAALTFFLSAGLLLFAGMAINLWYELRAPRTVRIAGALLTAEWRSERIELELARLRVERRGFFSLFLDSAIRVTNGTDAFFVLASISNYEDIVGMMERSSSDRRSIQD